MKKKDLNIVFMGTPDFAVPTLERLNSLYNVISVVTVPDKIKGRGNHLSHSEIKVKAQELGLRLLQPNNLNSERFINEITDLKPDLIVVVAFRIIPPSIYKIPKLGAFNIHASLLPKYRGAAPINWSIINGDKISGLTTFLLKEKVDTGDILLQEETRINSNMTFGDLYEKLKISAPAIAVDTIELLKSGRYNAISQDHTLATNAPKLFPADCEINWNNSAKQVKNLINGTSPTPGAWTIFNGKRIKILRAELGTGRQLNIGAYEISKNNWKVGCGEDNIDILEIQLPGKKPQKFIDFLNGWRGENTGNFNI